jgi:hypothetical protein
MIKQIPDIIPSGMVFVYKDARGTHAFGSLFIADGIRSSDKRQRFIGGRGNYVGETYHFDRNDIETNLAPLGDLWERKLTQLMSILSQLGPACVGASREHIYKLLLEFGI